MDYKKSLDFSDKSDYWEGLGISIHNVWANDISIKDYSFDGKNYQGTLKYTLYDHFGLNELDIDYSKTLIDKFGVQIYAKDLTLFRSWYLLQHNENYNGEYKPFVTVIEFERPFSGSIS